MRMACVFVTSFSLFVACSDTDNPKQESPIMEEAARPIPGMIRPEGDTEIKPDLNQVSAELRGIFEHIDENIDSHVMNLQRWIQQPSISNTGEGIPESAQYVKGLFDELGCQETRVFEMGETEWGSQGNPVVYAKCDEGADRTILAYWMYDTMPITQPDLWNYPPFEGRLVEQPPFNKVMIGRGATNTKGPHMVAWNALMSIKEVTGTLPVNVIFVAEGAEERMSLGLQKFVAEHSELLEGADALFFGLASQGASGGATVWGSSEGCVNFELTTSGAKWGRGPVYGDIHGGRKRAVDSPAWRHMTMLASLLTPDGNHAAVEGFYDDMVPLAKIELAYLEGLADKIDLKVAARNIGVGRFITDDPLEYLKMARYGTSWNMDGIFGGNMYGGGAGAILPSKITSKHHIRYIPNMDGMDLAQKVRAQLDKNGYPDVEMNVVGNIPWSRVNYDTEIVQAMTKTYEIFNIPYTPPPATESMLLAGFWASYLWRGEPLRLDIAIGGAGHGGNSHANNEYFVIEGAGNVYGMAGAEKSIATALYNYAGKN